VGPSKPTVTKRGEKLFPSYQKSPLYNDYLEDVTKGGESFDPEWGGGVKRWGEVSILNPHVLRRKGEYQKKIYRKGGCGYFLPVMVEGSEQAVRPEKSHCNRMPVKGPPRLLRKGIPSRNTLRKEGRGESFK